MPDYKCLESPIPVDAVIMAGGRGTRLSPLTDKQPKPLLRIGGKEIISFSFDRLLNYGVVNQNVVVNYLGHMIEDFCASYNVAINFNIIKEDQFLGTAGAMSLINKFNNDNIILLNSDILTDINYSDLYKSFVKSGADIMVASKLYKVSFPYAILNTEGLEVKSFQEKPTYEYYGNAGIYIMRKSVIDQMPKNIFYNATDLLEYVIKSSGKISHYPIEGYWIDIGNPKDFLKAQQDISSLSF